ncbi:cyclin-a2-4 [Anaeramoeba ignava]|uniref:Cyclin-a2-4 n=1 Tax=Anaeramoeba ignava TaxID=1746090 RepID=A0A9Q0LHX5_ANAIG|nr:cyclin-a2-4 [Anaeramoeba ignava]
MNLLFRKTSLKFLFQNFNGKKNKTKKQIENSKKPIENSKKMLEKIKQEKKNKHKIKKTVQNKKETKENLNVSNIEENKENNGKKKEQKPKHKRQIKKTKFRLFKTKRNEEEKQKEEQQKVEQKEEKEQIRDIDKQYSDNPLMVTEYVQNIFENMQKEENSLQGSKDYFEKIQTQINPLMRKILINWISEICNEYNLHSETLYLAVNYIDRFLSKNNITKRKLQLIGITCLFIASKYEEIYPPDLDEFVDLCAGTYSREEVLDCEIKLCNSLEFKLTALTAKHFLRRFIIASEYDFKLVLLANYLCELQLLEYTFIQFSPSIIAASCVALSNLITKKTNVFDSTLEFYSNHKLIELKSCMFELLKLFRQASSQKFNFPFKKYSKEEMHQVSQIELDPNLDVFFSEIGMNKN